MVTDSSPVESVVSPVEPVVAGEVCVVDAGSVVPDDRSPVHAPRTIRAEIGRSRFRWVILTPMRGCWSCVGGRLRWQSGAPWRISWRSSIMMGSVAICESRFVVGRLPAETRSAAAWRACGAVTQHQPSHVCPPTTMATFTGIKQRRTGPSFLPKNDNGRRCKRAASNQPQTRGMERTSPVRSLGRPARRNTSADTMGIWLVIPLLGCMRAWRD